jgi:ribonuclease E
VRKRRPPQGGRPRGGAGGGAGRPRGQDNVERPRTDETAVSAEGREQPVVEQVETTPAPVAEAPDTTTPKQQTEDPTTLEASGDPAAEEKPKPKRAPRKKKADT